MDWVKSLTCLSLLPKGSLQQHTVMAITAAVMGSTALATSARGGTPSRSHEYITGLRTSLTQRECGPDTLLIKAEAYRGAVHCFLRVSLAHFRHISVDSKGICALEIECVSEYRGTVRNDLLTKFHYLKYGHLRRFCERLLSIL